MGGTNPPLREFALKSISMTLKEYYILINSIGDNMDCSSKRIKRPLLNLLRRIIERNDIKRVRIDAKKMGEVGLKKLLKDSIEKNIEIARITCSNTEYSIAVSSVEVSRKSNIVRMNVILTSTLQTEDLLL